MWLKRIELIWRKTEVSLCFIYTSEVIISYQNLDIFLLFSFHFVMPHVSIASFNQMRNFSAISFPPYVKDFPPPFRIVSKSIRRRKTDLWVNISTANTHAHTSGENFTESWNMANALPVAQVNYVGNWNIFYMDAKRKLWSIKLLVFFGWQNWNFESSSSPLLSVVTQWNQSNLPR